MDKPCVTKAEVLLTRRCNLRCTHCAISNRKWKLREMGLHEWLRAFNIIYTKLGASFIALYGGEPLLLDRDKLLAIVRNLSGYRSKDRDFTLISNGTLLTVSYAEELVRAGLGSWTASVDTVYDRRSLSDRSQRSRAAFGLASLEEMRRQGVRNTMGIVTVHALNLGGVLRTVEELAHGGHCSHVELVHCNRGDGEYSFSADREALSKAGMLLTEDHYNQLCDLSDELLLRREELRVFTSAEVLRKWKDRSVSLGLGWKCGLCHAITVDCDGSIGLCDDRLPAAMGVGRRLLFEGGAYNPWHILEFDVSGQDLEEAWRSFREWYKGDLENCGGCFWGTHVMATAAQHSPQLRREFIHQAPSIGGSR